MLHYSRSASADKESAVAAVATLPGFEWLEAAIERGEELDPSGILSELWACSYLTGNVLAALHREGVDLGALCLGDVDEPRLARCGENEDERRAG
jgi:hypothetical protein